MISLFVDTSLSFIRIAIEKDGVLLDYINEKCEKDLSKYFIENVKLIFERNSLNINSVNKIFAVTGPGSFTGIRIGLTFAKILGWCLKINIIPISELQVLASSSFMDCLSLIDARRGYVYCGGYDCNLDCIYGDRYILLDDVINDFRDSSINYLSYDSFRNINCLFPDIDFLKIIIKNFNNEGIDPHVLVPSYLKNTEAEDKLGKKKQNDSTI